jgi:hypothetical protein
VVGRFAHANDPESCTNGSVATGRVSLAGQVKGQASDEEINPAGLEAVRWQSGNILFTDSLQKKNWTDPKSFS